MAYWISIVGCDTAPVINREYRTFASRQDRLRQAGRRHSATNIIAVAPKKSITPDYLICLEDGKKFKSLKRHLRTKYNMSPEEYRAKWGLPKDYPMVAPNYAKARSDLAKQMGLGQGGRQAAKKKR